METKESSITTKSIFGITERDMDFFFVRKFYYDLDFLNRFFLSEPDYKDKTPKEIEIFHSVTTEDGESDIEVILTFDNQKKIALLVEDKIDAPAMKNQAERYKTRGEKAVSNGKYNDFSVYILAPKSYLDSNAEAKKYPNRVSYESIRNTLSDPFEIEVIDKALAGYRGVTLARNQQVTDFWDKVYDFAEEQYKGVFNIHGYKGLERSGIPGQWITISCNNRFKIEIKSDRGFVDLEIKNYADKHELFCKDNKRIINEKKLCIVPASNSLAVRRYIKQIDFTKPFDEEKPALKEAFDAAKELQDIIHLINLR